MFFKKQQPAHESPGKLQSMMDQLFKRLGHHYLLAMMVLTRVSGTTGGILVVYYVNITMDLPENIRRHFLYTSMVVVLMAVSLSVLYSTWELRHLRRVLRHLAKGEKPDAQLAIAAGREAVLFPVRHHRYEAWMVPTICFGGVVIVLRIMDNASLGVLANIGLAVFMGVGMALMSTFFFIERCMQPVIRGLLDHDVAIDFDSLPANRLRSRLNLCFGLVILITALMIGTLARQRAADIINIPHNQDQAVDSLRKHTTYITIAAIVYGLMFASTISQSVASRVARLVQAMKRVERGSFSEKLYATGNDEIDTLARQFNSMVQQLAQNDGTIRDLNTNLERKVEERTLTLRLLHEQLDQRNTDLETAFKELQETQSQLMEVAHRAGMTEIATGVLHNVGNVLNSVNVSITILCDNLRKSRVASVTKLAELLNQHTADFARAAATDERLKKVPEYLNVLADALTTEQREMGTEVNNLAEKVQHIKNIIKAQQNYTRRVSFTEQIDLQVILEDLLAIHGPSLVKNAVKVERDYEDLPTATIEKSKLLQVLDNLVKNAIESMVANGDHRVLTLKMRANESRATISVSDTGRGITEEQLSSMFRFGFTTKTNGNGFGLHSSAIAMNEMGGTIKVHSDGLGTGATFTIELPLIQEKDKDSTKGRMSRVLVEA